MRTDACGEALELAPLRGLRYATPDARTFIDSPAFNLALALAPPYDVLDATAFEDLMRAEPRNAVRLTAPPAAGAVTRSATGRPETNADRYQAAARTLRRWIDDGVLVRDPAPVLYVYEQTAPNGERQRGLIGALRLPRGDGSVVRPHESVAAAAVTDRVRLMAATRANLEPIFLLYRGGTGAGRGAAARATDAAASTSSAPLIDTVTGDGVTHRIWPLADPGTIADVAADLATRSALIADGHHRYAAYQRLRGQQNGPGPWDHGLALLVDSDSSPPRLGAIHRVLRGLDVHTAARAAAEVAEVDRLPGPGDGENPLDDDLARLHAAATEGPALLLAGSGPPGTRYLLRDLAPERLAEAAPDRSPTWRELPTAALEMLLPLWDIGEQRIQLVHDDPAGALSAARPGRDTAVLLPPLRVADVYAVAGEGELLPRKSTSFGPKPRTGLVLRSLD